MIKSRLLVYGIMVSMLLGAGFIDAAAEGVRLDTERALAVFAKMSPHIKQYVQTRYLNAGTAEAQHEISHLILGNRQFVQEWNKTFPQDPLTFKITNYFMVTNNPNTNDVTVDLVPTAE